MVNDTLVDTSISIVTVAVITYNSAKTVAETLDSIVAQSYGSQNIELIISDDGSTDNTATVINGWLRQYRHQFYSVKFFDNKTNGGVSKNCNIAWKAASAEWLKTIAGDDLLHSNCIEDNVTHVQKNPHVDILFSSMIHFQCDDINNALTTTPDIKNLSFFKLQASEQFSFLVKNSFNIAPTSFMKKSVLSSVGFCCEEYRYLEDLPLWLKLTRTGHKLYFMNKETVHYRISNSLSNSVSRLVNIDFIKQVHLVHKKEIWPHLPKSQMWRIYDKQVEYISWLIPYKLFKNKRNFLSLSVHYLLSCFRPVAVKKILERVHII